MPVLFKNQNNLEYFQHLPTGSLIAVTRDDAKRFKMLSRKYRGANKIPSSEKIKGFLFILDDEFQSLKIDFENEIEVKLNEVINAQLK